MGQCFYLASLTTAWDQVGISCEFKLLLITMSIHVYRQAVLSSPIAVCHLSQHLLTYAAVVSGGYIRGQFMGRGGTAAMSTHHLLIAVCDRQFCFWPLLQLESGSSEGKDVSKVIT